MVKFSPMSEPSLEKLLISDIIEASRRAHTSRLRMAEVTRDLVLSRTGIAFKLPQCRATCAIIEASYGFT